MFFFYTAIISLLSRPKTKLGRTDEPPFLDYIVYIYRRSQNGCWLFPEDRYTILYYITIRVCIYIRMMRRSAERDRLYCVSRDILSARRRHDLVVVNYHHPGCRVCAASAVRIRRAGARNHRRGGRKGRKSHLFVMRSHMSARLVIRYRFTRET